MVSINDGTPKWMVYFMEHPIFLYKCLMEYDGIVAMWLKQCHKTPTWAWFIPPHL
jgi:hypothetical protein